MKKDLLGKKKCIGKSGRGTAWRKGTGKKKPGSKRSCDPVAGGGSGEKWKKNDQETDAAYRRPYGRNQPKGLLLGTNRRKEGLPEEQRAKEGKRLHHS